VFRDHYQRYCARVLRGESLEIPEPEVLEHHAAEPLPKAEQLEALKKLKEEAGF